MSLNIVHINFSDQGGSAVASMDLHEELLKQGVNSKYLVLNLSKKYPAEKHYYSHRRIYKSIIEKAWYLYIKAKWIEWKNNRILSKIKEPNDVISTPYSCFDITKDPLYKKADIIHLHWTARFLDWPSFFKKNKKPVVWTLHDRNPFSGVLHCKTDFPVSAQNIESFFIQKKKEWIKKSNITIVSPSTEYKIACLESHVFQNCIHKVIHHGIPDEIFFPIDKEKIRNNYGIPINKKIVLSVASDISRSLKGSKKIISIAKKMTDIIFILVGTKSAKTEPFNNIVYTGQINDRVILNEWYNCADVTISNSEEESFGLSIAESLKTGTPIIMKNTGLFSDIITKKNGLKGSPSLIHTINKFYEKSFEKKEIIESSQKLNISTYIDKHVKMYNSIL